MARNHFLKKSATICRWPCGPCRCSPYLQLASLPLNAPIPDVGEQASLRSLAPPEERLPKASWAKLRRSTLAPMAFVRYCKQNKAKCETRGASQIKLSSTTLSLIDRVNRDVNRAILPQNESKDVWRDNVKVGDCEDFALTKRAQLVRMGFSSAALRMAVAKTPRGEGHAVLVVSTTRGGLRTRQRGTTKFARSSTQTLPG